LSQEDWCHKNNESTAYAKAAKALSPGGVMLQSGPAKKVSIYVGEDHQYHGHALYVAILDFLFQKGVAGANVVRGIAGFGADHHLHTTRILRLTEDLPIRIEFIESSEKIQELLPALSEMVHEGLITTSEVEVIKHEHPDRAR
jgi:PII-like signaling protein